MKRVIHWHIKDLRQKNIILPVGMLSFTCTRFKNKETKGTAYLLDRAIGLGAHARMGDGVKAAILKEAVKTSYEKAGREACPGGCVSRKTVMRRHVRGMEIPPKSIEGPAEKKKTKNLYAGACKIPERRKNYKKNRRRKIFQCNRSAYMGEQTQKNKWEIL